MIIKENKTYKMNPIEGEALLNYKGRLSADELYMQLYEIDEEKGELVNTKDNQEIDGKIFKGDCLSVCAHLKEKNEKVDFVYIDPPFASGANYSKKIFVRSKENTLKENTTQINSNTVGEEIMYEGIWSKEDYLNWIYTRLLAIKEILSENGSIMVHLNSSVGYYVKILMDEVFGEENFINEIIWGYRTGGVSEEKALAEKHQMIYFYSKNTDFTINTLKERQYLEKEFMGSPKDEEGRFYSDTKLRDILEDVINIVNPDGTIEPINVRPVLNLSSEFLGYPNQKPKELIKLLMRIATKDGDVVADFFGGSGSTALAAYESNKKFITCDVSENSIQTMRDNLKKHGAKFEIINIKDGLNLLRNPTQTIKKLFKTVAGEERNENSEYSNLWDGKILYNKKFQCAKIIDSSKILDENYIDYLLNQIQEDHANNEQDEYLILYVYKTDEVSQKTINQKVKNLKLEVKINLVAIEEILNVNRSQMYMPDSVNFTVKELENKKYEVKIENYFSPYLKEKIDEENERRVKKEKSVKLNVSESGYEFIEMISFDTTFDKKWNSSVEEVVRDNNKQIKGVYILDTNKFKMKIRNIAGEEIIVSSGEVV